MASLLSILLLLACPFIGCHAQNSRKELRSKEVSQETVLQSSSSIQSTRVYPDRVVQLSWRPRVFIYRGFMSYDECDHLISLARETSTNSVGNARALSASSESILDMEDKVVTRLNERISAWTLLPPENGRSLRVLHYEHEERKRTYDFIGDKSQWGVSEPLMATVVLYLSNVTHGGDIFFPQAQLKQPGLRDRIRSYRTSETKNLLRPMKGTAVLFFNVRPNSTPDQSSSHERHPVLEGDMWCAVKFFHLRPVTERRAPPRLEDTECTDEDDSCPQWAARGECQRNPVFMVGSPDYYGTCRKSCNVC